MYTRSVWALGLSIALALSGCASMETKWKRVTYGQTLDEVMDIMGNPDAFQHKDGKNSYAWAINAYQACGADFGSDGRVESKNCKVDESARARQEAAQQQAAMMYMQMRAQQTQPSFTPVQSYQPKQNLRTNCQTRWVGGTAYSDCSSSPTGIDTSIYR